MLFMFNEFFIILLHCDESLLQSFLKLKVRHVKVRSSIRNVEIFVIFFYTIIDAFSIKNKKFFSAEQPFSTIIHDNPLK